VFASTPRELRRARASEVPAIPTAISLRLPYRAPFAGEEVISFLGSRAVPGLEAFDGAVYRRSLELPHGEGIAALSLGNGHVRCELSLADLRDLTAAVQRCRGLLDLDADPAAIGDVLGADASLRPAVRKWPGLRVPGSVNGTEMAVRAILGQQVSVKGARTLAGRLVAAYGEPLEKPAGPITHTFPSALRLADASLDEIGMPAARRRALKAVAAAIAAGDVALDGGADRSEARTGLLEIPGIGPWTASYLQMRALHDPDAFLVSDLGVVKGAAHLGIESPLEEVSERWRPWRAYAVQYLWQSLSDDSLGRR
jgi:AraC family transcriptional regulator of adaptative response / DNA-3-methyladenine glycosylase II